MPTTGGKKSGDSLFCITFSPHPSDNLNLTEFPIVIIFISDDEIPRNLIVNQRMFQILKENGLNSKLKHKESSKVDFMWDIWWPVQETRRLVLI